MRSSDLILAQLEIRLALWDDLHQLLEDLQGKLRYESVSHLVEPMLLIDLHDDLQSDLSDLYCGMVDCL
jgi:hypothetical protein